MEELEPTYPTRPPPSPTHDTVAEEEQNESDPASISPTKPPTTYSCPDTVPSEEHLLMSVED
jgi:hypothetical protein